MQPLLVDMAIPALRPVSDHRRLRQRGNFNLEMALVFIPLFAIFMGIIDVSFALFKRSLLQAAVREGVRYAVTYQTSGNTGNNHDLSIKRVVHRQCIGFLTEAQRDQLITIRYYEPFTNPSGQADWRLVTGSGSNRPGNLVEIGIENYEHNYIVPLWHMLNARQPYSKEGWQRPQPMRVSVYAADRMEGLPAGVFTPPSR